MKNAYRTLTITTEDTTGKRSTFEVYCFPKDSLVELAVNQFELARSEKKIVISASVEKLTAAEKREILTAKRGIYGSVVLIKL